MSDDVESCYICLENTTESSCDNGCAVHDQCMREALRSGHPEHCTICRGTLKPTDEPRRSMCDRRFCQELFVAAALLSQIMLAVAIIAGIVVMSRIARS